MTKTETFKFIYTIFQNLHAIFPMGLIDKLTHFKKQKKKDCIKQIAANFSVLGGLVDRHDFVLFGQLLEFGIK